MTQKIRSLARWAFFLLVWAFLAIFLARALERLPDANDWARLAEQGGLPAMAVFALCFTAALVLRAIRFGFLTRLSMPLPWPSILRAFPWLFMLGAITPFRLGEGMRVQWVRRQGGSGVTALGNWAAERWSDMMILGTFLVLGLAPVTMDGLEGPDIWLLVCAIAGAYGAFWYLRARLMRACRFLPRGRTKAQNLLRSFEYMSEHRLHISVLAMTFGIWGLMGLGFWAALSILTGSPVPVVLALGCLAAVNLLALISATPGNLVSFQAAMISVMSAWGYQPMDALLASIIIQSSGLMVAIAAGLIARLLMYIGHPKGQQSSLAPQNSE